MAPLARVIEISATPAAGFAGMLLAELGAHVLRVVLPQQGRGAPGEHDPADAFLHRGKESLALDLRAQTGREQLRRLASTADALIEDLGPKRRRRLRISYRGLRGGRAGFTMVSISPFGLTGPWAAWEGPEIVVQATGGILAGTGYNDSPPYKLPGRVAHHVAGLNAATAALVAVHGVRSGLESGVHIDISAQEAFAAHWARHISQSVYAGAGTRRPPRGMGLQGFPHTAKASDGLVYLQALRADWESLAFFLGLEQFANHEWADPRKRVEQWAEIDPHFVARMASRGRYEWTAAAAEHGYTFAPVDDPLSVMASPHLEARGFFRELILEDGTTVMCPGLPFKLRTPAGTKIRRPEQ